jgi:hypothetical protein
MMDIGQMNRPTLLLIAANVVLSLVIALQLLYPAQPYRAATATLPDSASALPQFGDVSLSPPRMADLTDMLARPLFFVDRRLPEPRAEAVPAAPPKPLRLKLEGVAISGGSRVAVLRDLSNSISSNIASFSRGEQVSELPLDPGSNGRRR